MKTKVCVLCSVVETTLYRIQIQKGKTWIFVCKTCCIQAKTKPEYRYGGTWKGARH